MPNECYNYVRISTSNETLRDLIKSKDFIPENYFDPSSKDLLTWRYENFGTERFFGHHGKPTINKDDITLFFQTSWAPPIEFYRRLVETYPDLSIYYEYNEFYMSFCGYGSFRTNNLQSQPNHFLWNSKEELEQIKSSHPWYMTPWDPHFHSTSTS